MAWPNVPTAACLQHHNGHFFASVEILEPESPTGPRHQKARPSERLIFWPESTYRAAGDRPSSASLIEPSMRTT